MAIQRLILFRTVSQYFRCVVSELVRFPQSENTVVKFLSVRSSSIYSSVITAGCEKFMHSSKMDWILPVNEILEDEITKVTSTMMPPSFSGDVRAVRAMQDSLAKIIDALGEQSAAAQGLSKVITTAEKLRNSPGHVLYLLKDHRGKEGKGDVIGMLKVGRKHLFLFDEQNQVHEVQPLCVLDFYVLRDRQRMGYGRRLFDWMLHDLEMLPWEMAIDGPSPKMEKFLSRTYGVDRLMRQNNNFAVAPGFFDRSDEDISSLAGPKTPSVSAAVGRFAAPKPASAIANVIHGPCHEDAARRSGTPDAAGPSRPSAQRDDVGEWDDDWAPPSDEDEDDDEEPDEPDELPDEYEPEPPRSPAGAARPESLGVQRGDAAVPAAGMPSAGAGGPSGAASAAGTPSGAAGRRDSQLTDRGYFDVKYYHNKLW